MGIAHSHKFTSLNDAAEAVAGRLVQLIAESTAAGAPVFSLALPGGRSARAVFDAFARRVQGANLNIANLHLFWGDERCVPPQDAESNFKIAAEALIQPLRLSSEQVHRVLGETPQDYAAKQAEAELCRIAPLNASGVPVIDVVLLGMGEDGHVASLFPGADEATVNSNAVYVPVIGPKPPPQRISLTYPVIFEAKHVFVVASGIGKKDALIASLSPNGATPMARCIQRRNATEIFTDF